MSKKSPWKKIIAAGAVLGCFYAVLQAAAVKRAEEKDIDKGNPYRKKKSGKQECGKQEGNIYLHRIKPALDKFLSCRAGGVRPGLWSRGPGHSY